MQGHIIIIIPDEKQNNYNKASEAENTTDKEMLARILQLLYNYIEYKWL